jgi:hypothetical protein
MKKMELAAALAAVLAAAGGASAAPVGVDGLLGAEWNGVSAVQVTHDAGAPIGNFGTPGPTTAGASYDIRVRGDGSYVYVLLQITGDAASSAGQFANLYFDTNPAAADGSDVGFEVTNNRYFVAGDPGGNYYDASAFLTYDASVAGSIELAIDDAFFTSGPRAGVPFPIGYPASTDEVVLRLSQSFGYSVAGGATYGPNRLGAASLVAAAAVPEPGSVALVLAALGGLGLASRRNRAR